MSAEMDHTPHELRQMSEDEARQQLTVVQFERWEKIQSLYEEAEANRREFANDAQEATDIVVHADPQDLGVALDLYGNDIVVYVESDNRDLAQMAETLQNKYGDLDDEDLDALTDDTRDDIAESLIGMLDAVILQWNGTTWDDIDAAEREQVLRNARTKWGLDGLLVAWLRIVEAIEADREDKRDVIESFRGAERTGPN